MTWLELIVLIENGIEQGLINQFDEVTIEELRNIALLIKERGNKNV